MSQTNWNGGAGDVNDPSNWTPAAPRNGDVATIGAGIVQVTAADIADAALPASITLDMGVLQVGTAVAPSSVLDVIDANLLAGVIINNVNSGGSFQGSFGSTIVGSMILANGAVQSQATINVGAGDETVIAIQQDVSSAPGSFANLGTINVVGGQSNYALLTVMPASTGGAGASAAYGAINLQYGALVALASDSAVGSVNIGSGGLLFDLADLQQTNAVFANQTGRIDVGENLSGELNGVGTSAEYSFGGNITNFQSGDSIGLMQSDASAIPASVSYNSTTDILTIKDASGNTLGALNIQLNANSANDQFVLTQHISGADYASGAYSGQYDIVLADAFANGVTADFNTAANWQGDAVPASSGVAVIGASTATLSASLNTPETILLGAAATSSFSAWGPGGTAPASTSSFSITNNNIGSSVVLDVTKPGGTLTATSNTTVMYSGFGFNGAVTDSGTINVGAGDGLSIGVALPNSGPSAGAFINAGVINVMGTASNLAFMQIKQGSASRPSAPNASAAYGAVNLSYGVFYAKAPDFNPSTGVSTGSSQFSLSNDSTLALLSGAGFKTAGVTFKDNSDTLLLKEDSAGQYYDGGSINGFQTGDIIGLLPNDASGTPASLQYDGAGGVLTIGPSLGQLNFTGNYFAEGFSLSTTPITSIAGVSEYQITYSVNALGITNLSALAVASGATYAVGQSGQPGAVNVQGAVTLDGEMDVGHAANPTGGTVIAAGALTVDAGGTLAIGESATPMASPSDVAASSLVNNGTISLVGDGAEALLKIASAAGTGSAGILTGNVSLSGNAALNFASGLINTLSGDLTLTGTQASLGITGNTTQNKLLSGLASISGGALFDLESGATTASGQSLSNAGTIDIDANGGSGGSILTVSGSLANAGAINIGNDAIQTSDDVNVIGGLTNSGAITFAQSSGQGLADLNVGAASENVGVISGNGTINASSAMPTFAFTNDAAGQIGASSGNAIFLSGFSAVVNNGVFVITGGGSINVAQSFSSGALGSLVNVNSIQMSNGAQWANLGVLGSLDNKGTITGEGQILAMSPSGGILTNETGATINATTSNGLGLDSWSSILNNGLIETTNGNLQINATLSGAGDLTANGGQLTLSNPVLASGVWTYTAENNGALTINGALMDVGISDSGTLAANGGFIRLAGAVSGNISAVISDGGTLELDSSFAGNSVQFSLGSGGMLSIGDLASSVAGAQQQDFNAVISGFVPGDTIAVSAGGLGGYGALTSVQAVSYNSATNITTLALDDGASGVAALRLQGDYSAAEFALTADPAHSQYLLSTVGTAVDGYIEGATVFADANNNGVLDAGEAQTITDSRGQFVLQGGSGPLVLIGGVDTSTGLQFRGMLQAPNGYSVITPLSTLVAAQLPQNATSADLQTAEQMVLTSLGVSLSAGQSLATLDPVAGALAGDPSASAAFLANAKIADTVTMLGAALSGATGASAQAATTAVVQALARQIIASGGQPLDLTDTNQIGGLLTAADQSIDPAGQNPLGAAFVAATDTVVQSSNQLIQSSSASGASEVQFVSKAETVAQGGTSGALQNLPANPTPSQVDDLTQSYTGSALAEAVDTICFMAGTMIRTPDGEAPIEMLKCGDQVLTTKGICKPVCWLGKQTVSKRFADPLRNFPVRIEPGALGEKMPSRTLLVSPDHALLIDGLMIQAGALVNGTSITREYDVPDVFVYYHVELEDHSLIFAENTPAETFVDNVDRMNFDNWSEHEALYPDGRPIVELSYPRAKGRRQVPLHIRAALDERAQVIGALEIAAVA